MRAIWNHKINNLFSYLYNLIQVPLGGLQVPLLEFLQNTLEQLGAVRLRDLHSREQVRVYTREQWHVLMEICIYSNLLHCSTEIIQFRV